MIPLLPGFQGDITKSESSFLKLQYTYEQNTINKGESSLFAQLEKEGIDPDKYIRFRGLRTHDVYPNTNSKDHSDSSENVQNIPTQAIVYVHSKLMIVDDRKFIIGSANINDRSMLGTRDSEIAIVWEDLKIAQSMMSGKRFIVGETPHNFRVDIFKGKLLLCILNTFRAFRGWLWNCSGPV